MNPNTRPTATIPARIALAKGRRVESKNRDGSVASEEKQCDQQRRATRTTTTHHIGMVCRISTAMTLGPVNTKLNGSCTSGISATGLKASLISFCSCSWSSISKPAACVSATSNARRWSDEKPHSLVSRRSRPGHPGLKDFHELAGGIGPGSVP